MHSLTHAGSSQVSQRKINHHSCLVGGGRGGSHIHTVWLVLEMGVITGIWESPGAVLELSQTQEFKGQDRGCHVAKC